MRRSIWRVAALAAVMAGIGALAVPVSAQAITCGDVMLVWARGSGEGLNAKEAQRFFIKTQERLTGLEVASYELGSESHGGATYPAVGGFRDMLEADASWTGPLGGQYRSSVQKGKTELQSFLGERSTACPDEVFVLGGYSQGAHVVGEGLFDLSRSIRDRVVFVSLFSDPKLYLPEGRGIFPAGCRGQKSSWRRGSVGCWTVNGVLESRNPYLPDDIQGRVGSWCDRNDGICTDNIALIPGALGAHDEYAEEGAEIDEAAREIATRLAERFPGQASTIDTSILIIGVGTAGLDVAVVIDTTGSMGDDIAAARSIASQIGGDVVAQRGRVAIVEYRDFGDPFVARVDSALSSNIDAFRSTLDALTVDGGGDTPEALLSALMEAFDNLAWKGGATKAAVVLTDADFHDPESATGFTLASVARRSLEIDPVNVYPVVPTFLADYYQPLADATSGKVVPNSGDTGQALLSAITQIRLRPIALLALDQYFAEPGDSIIFDASGSYDPDSEITGFDWDFDGDGVVDESTTAGVATHVYDSPFDGPMEVRVHSADGGVANASAIVHVNSTGLGPLLPGTVPSLSAEEVDVGSTSRTVHLSWTPPSDGGVVDGWVVRGSDGQLLTRLLADTTELDVLDVPLTEVSFSVEATNQYGEGPAATATVTAAEPALRPVRFDIAARAGASVLRATGVPTATATQGSVSGVVRGQRVNVAITEAGQTTIDGREVIVVRFPVNGQWELQFRPTFLFLGQVALCGPTGCQSGAGVNLAVVFRR